MFYIQERRIFMGKYILGTLIILIFGFIISKILIDLGRNEDEMGIYILEKALSKTIKH